VKIVHNTNVRWFLGIKETYHVEFEDHERWYPHMNAWCAGNAQGVWQAFHSGVSPYNQMIFQHVDDAVAFQMTFL
jgi:hypothetical protein